MRPRPGFGPISGARPTGRLGLLAPRVTVRWALAVGAIAPAPAPAPALAQSDVSVELGASRVGPPAGLDAASARFGVGGLRASHRWSGGSGLSAALLVGRAFGETAGGDFLSATAGANVSRGLGEDWTAGLEVTTLGFDVRAPFPYRVLAAEGGPTLTYRSTHVSVEIAGVVGAGRSRVELRRRTSDVGVVLEDDLWRVGGTTEVLLGSRPVWVGVAGGAHRTNVGTYGVGGARLVWGGTRGAAEVWLDVWDAPLGRETTGGLALALPLGGGWSLRGFLGKTEPDPLTLAEAGSGSAGLLLGRSLYHAEAASGERSSLFEVLEEVPRGARIRVAVEVPEGAARVALLGDFTLWDAVPMKRDGRRWVAELEVPVGTHHFGFLVDDEWYVPDDAPDVVPDEWGRRSATLVIEGEGS